MRDVPSLKLTPKRADSMRKIFYQECRKAGKKEHRQEELALRYCFLFLPSCLPDSFILDGSAPLGAAACCFPDTKFLSS
jgi:hypothetical protein